MRPPNLANLLVFAGLIGLGVTFFEPHLSARRVARVESRALEVAQALSAAVVEFEPLDLVSPADRDVLLQSLRARCSSLGHPASDLPESIPDASWPTFGNRHYLFRVVRAPVPVPRPRDWDPEARRPLEVYAWPRSLLPPGRSAFYFPAAGRPAYSRNLAAEYRGVDRAPPPGAGQPASAEDLRSDQLSYRSRDDERWLLLPPSALQPGS